MSPLQPLLCLGANTAENCVGEPLERTGHVVISTNAQLPSQSKPTLPQHMNKSLVTDVCVMNARMCGIRAFR